MSGTTIGWYHWKLACCLFTLKRSHFRWFWHLISKCPGHSLPASNLEEILTGLHVHLAWKCLMIPQKELKDLTVAALFSLQPQSPAWTPQKWMDGKSVVNKLLEADQWKMSIIFICLFIWSTFTIILISLISWSAFTPVQYLSNTHSKKLS